MPYLNETTGLYYFGDKQLGDIEVPERPTAHHKWVNGAWQVNLAQLKAASITELKARTQVKFAPTDWAITRSIDPTSKKAIPQTIMDERKAIRDECDAKEAAINAATTAEDIVRIMGYV